MTKKDVFSGRQIGYVQLWVVLLFGSPTECAASDFFFQRTNGDQRLLYDKQGSVTR